LAGKEQIIIPHGIYFTPFYLKDPSVVRNPDCSISKTLWALMGNPHLAGLTQSQFQLVIQPNKIQKSWFYEEEKSHD